MKLIILFLILSLFSCASNNATKPMNENLEIVSYGPCYGGWVKFITRDGITPTLDLRLPHNLNDMNKFAKELNIDVFMEIVGDFLVIRENDVIHKIQIKNCYKQTLFMKGGIVRID
jgi:hypothetical protein